MWHQYGAKHHFQLFFFSYDTMRGKPNLDGTDTARLRGNESPSVETDSATPVANGFSTRIPVNIAPSHQE
jgi:hypothetical protein